jgi:hypothetical protein
MHIAVFPAGGMGDHDAVPAIELENDVDAVFFMEPGSGIGGRMGTIGRAGYRQRKARQYSEETNFCFHIQTLENSSDYCLHKLGQAVLIS